MTRLAIATIATATITGAVLALGGCATPNTFDVPRDRAAVLVNTYVNVRGAYYGYFFSAVDKQAKGKDFVSLRPGLITAERDASYLVPAGRRGIKIRMVYAPQGVGALKPQYDIWGYAAADLNAGRKYRGRGEVLNDQALIWIEDAGGQRVSDKVRPFLVIKRR